MAQNLKTQQVKTQQVKTQQVETQQPETQRVKTRQLELSHQQSLPKRHFRQPSQQYPPTSTER
jgi:hypothetical protein